MRKTEQTLMDLCFIHAVKWYMRALRLELNYLKRHGEYKKSFYFGGRPVKNSSNCPDMNIFTGEPIITDEDYEKYVKMIKRDR